VKKLKGFIEEIWERFESKGNGLPSSYTITTPTTTHPHISKAQNQSNNKHVQPTRQPYLKTRRKWKKKEIENEKDRNHVRSEPYHSNHKQRGMEGEV